MGARGEKPSGSAQGGKRRRSRLARWARRLGILLVILVGVGVTLVLARNAILRAAVKPRLEAMLGVELSSGRIHARADGTVSMYDLVLRAPGVPGEAGAVLSAERGTAVVDLARLFGGAGAGAVLDVEASRPVFRLSQAVVDGTLNIDPIVRHVGAGGGAPSATGLRLPQIRIRDGLVEFGEHQAEWYNPLATLRVEGVLEAPDAASPDYRLTLTEITEELRPPMQLTGRIDAASGAARLEMVNLDLSAWDPASAPTHIRALWSRLAIAGVAPRAVFNYDPVGGLSAEFQLAGVSVTLPAPLGAGADDTTPQFLRMRDVDGAIRFDRNGLRADLTGYVEEVRAQVRLETQGLDLLAPFDAEIVVDPFFFREGVGVALFAPPEAQRIMRLFMGPQAIVGGRVHFARQRQGSDVAVDGDLDFTDGQMAFHRFPYPVQDISGKVLFDEEGLALRGLRGFGHTGAVIACEGEVIGYDDRAGVDIRIRTEHTPVDDVLAAAMPESWRPLIDRLMNREAYDRLRAAGLVQHDDDRAALAREIDRMREALAAEEGLRTSQRIAREAEIAALGERLRIPEFEPGGVGEGDVRIVRPYGDEGDYTFDIRVRIPDAALLPDALPYPLLADVLRIDVDDTRVMIEAGGLRGLTGGAGGGLIELDLSDREAAPSVDILMSSVPIDAMLLSAVPDTAPGMEAQGLSLRAIVRDLGLRGSVDPTIRVRPGEGDEVLYEIALAFKNVSAEPVGAGYAVVTGLSGLVRVHEAGFELSSVHGMLDASTMQLDARYETRDDASAEVRLLLDGLTLQTPIETLVRAFSRDAAESIADLRGRYTPTGRVDVDAALYARADAEPTIELRLHDAQDLSFDALDGRMMLASSSGGARYEPAASRVVFEGFEAPVAFEGEPQGEVALDGWIGLGDGAGMEIRAMLRGGRFESELLRRGLASWFGESWGQALRDRNAAGVFAASALVETDADGAQRVEGWLSPGSVAFDIRGERVEVLDAGGRISFSPTGGRIEGLRLVADGWDASLDGSWSLDESLRIEADGVLAAMGWPKGLAALLPGEAKSTIDTLSLRIDGPWSMQDARLELDIGGEPFAVQRGAFHADMIVHDASFDVGAKVENAMGAAALSLEWQEGMAPVVQMDAYFETLSALGVPMSDARAHIESDASTGRLIVQDFSADFCNGRIAGSAMVTGVGGGSAARYAADLRLAGVDFGMLVEELGDGRSGGAPGDGGRGVVSGFIAISGATDEPDARLGRGLLLVEAGEILRLPLLLPVLELTNLQAPVGERLTFGVVEFAMEGSLVSIERIVAESDSLTVAGQGTLLLPSGEVDLTFTTRGRRRLPLISDILDALRNELLGARVSGTLADPRFRAQALPRAGRGAPGLAGSSRRETGMVGGPPQREGREGDPPRVRLER